VVVVVTSLVAGCFSICGEREESRKQFLVQEEMIMVLLLMMMLN
jgi:hypothetical protein